MALIILFTCVSAFCAEPTFEQTLQWLKEKYETNGTYFWSSVPLVRASLLYEFKSHKSGTIVLNQQFSETRKDGSPYKNVTTLEFRLSQIERAVAEGTQVGILAVNKKKVIKVAGEGDGHYVEATVIFAVADTELNQPVAKAWNHLIKLAPKDDLFK